MVKAGVLPPASPRLALEGRVWVGLGTVSMLGGAERLGRVPSGHRQALGHGSTSLETAEWRGPRAYGWGRPGPPGSVFASAAVLRAASHRMPALGRGPRACAGGRAPADAHRAVGDADAVALWPRAGLVCGAVCHRCPLRWAGHPPRQSGSRGSRASQTHLSWAVLAPARRCTVAWTVAAGFPRAC